MCTIISPIAACKIVKARNRYLIKPGEKTKERLLSVTSLRYDYYKSMGKDNKAALVLKLATRIMWPTDKEELLLEQIRKKIEHASKA